MEGVAVARPSRWSLIFTNIQPDTSRWYMSSAAHWGALFHIFIMALTGILAFMRTKMSPRIIYVVITIYIICIIYLSWLQKELGHGRLKEENLHDSIQEATPSLALRQPGILLTLKLLLKSALLTWPCPNVFAMKYMKYLYLCLLRPWHCVLAQSSTNRSSIIDYPNFWCIGVLVALHHLHLRRLQEKDCHAAKHAESSKSTWSPGLQATVEDFGFIKTMFQIMYMSGALTKHSLHAGARQHLLTASTCDKDALQSWIHFAQQRVKLNWPHAWA